MMLGYAGRLECITADANVFTTVNRFDRIFSIEMFEVRFLRVVEMINISKAFGVNIILKRPQCR